MICDITNCVCQPIVGQYSSVMLTLEASGAQTLRMDRTCELLSV